MNKAIKWGLIVFVGIFVAAVAGVYFALTGYDYNALKPRIASAVQDATGRDLEIGGDIDLSVGLTPSLVLSDIRFSNAPWGSRAQLATVKRFEVQVALAPLLKKNIEVKKFILVEPDILVETDASGKLNVVFDKPATEKKPEKPVEKKDDGAMALPALSLNQLVVENGTVTFKDGKTGQVHSAKIKELKAGAESMDSPLNLELDAVYNESNILLSGVLGAASAAMDPKKDWPVELTVKALGVESTVKGKVTDLMAPSGIDMAVTARIEDFGELNALLKPMLKMDLPPVTPVRMAARIADTGEMAFTVSDLDLSFGDDKLNGQVKGRIGNVNTQEGVDLNASLLVSDLAPLMPYLEPYLKPHLKDGVPPVTPLRFKADIKGDANKAIAVENLDFAFGKDGFEGAVKGSVRNALAREGIALNASMLIADFAPLLPFLKPYLKNGPPPVAPVSFKAEIKGDMDKALSMNGLDFTFGKDSVKGSVKGSVRDLTAQRGIDLAATADISDFAELSAFLGTELPPVAPVSFKTKVTDGGPKVYKLGGLALTFAGNDISGSATANLSGKTPSVKADLSSRRMDVNSIVESMKKEEGGEAGKPSAGEKPTSAESGRPDKLFPNDPLPLDLLKTADADIGYKAENLFLPKLALHKVDLGVTVSNGALSVTPLKAELGGGSLDGNIGLKPRDGKTADLKAVVKTTSFDLGGMLKELAITDLMSGKVNLEVNLSGSGGSVAGLMGGLDGFTKIFMENGAIDNRYVGLIGAELGTAFEQVLAPAKGKKGVTAINCFVNRFDFKKGVADTTVLFMDSEYMVMMGEGKIDLGGETLDMAVAPKPKDKVADVGSSIGQLAENFRIGGTLASPKVKVDVAKAAKTVEKALSGAIETGSLLGIVAALEGDTAGVEDLCPEAKEAAEAGRKMKIEKKSAAEKKAPAPEADKAAGTGEAAPEQKDKPLTKEEKRKQDVEKIGGALKKLLGE